MPRKTIQRRRTRRRAAIAASIAGLIVVVAAALHTANRFQNDRLLNRARAEGLAAYAEGDLAVAADRLGLYHARKPDDAEVTLALAGARAGKPDATGADLRVAASLALAASDLMPDNIDPVTLEIQLRRKLGQHTELLSAADRALAIEPTSTEAATARVQALTALGRRDEALDAALAHAQRAPDDAESHRLVLVLLTGLDRATAAARVAEYADMLEAEHPSDPRFLILAAQARAQVRDLEGANAAVERLLDPAIGDRLDPASLASATQLLDILGRRDAADRLLERFLERQPSSPDIAAVAVERAYKQGRLDLASRRAQDAIAAADQISPELALWAAVCDLPESPQTTSQDAGTGFYPAMAEGIAQLKTGAPAQAARRLADARTERPTSRIAMHLLAVALERMGNPNEAARVRERLLRIAPDYTIARLAHIQALLDRDRPAEAAAVARVGLQIEPTSGALGLALAYATADLASVGPVPRADLDHALRIAESLDQNQDQDQDADQDQATPATAVRARLLLALGLLGDADRAIARVLEGDATDAVQLLALAADARRAGAPAAAELARRAEQRAAADPGTLLAVATAMHAEGRTAEALELVDRVVPSADADLTLRLARAVFLDRIASPAAGDELAALFRAHPDDPVVLTAVLESDAAWTDEPLVTAAVTALQNLTADTSDAWRFHEARRLLRFNEAQARAAEAVRLLEPLASSETASPRAGVLLAEALLRLGDAEAAITQLALAADGGLTDPALLLRLGWMHHARGEIDAAKRRARAVAEIEPVDPAFRRERVALLATVGLLEVAQKDASYFESSGSPTDLALAASIAARTGDKQALERRLDALRALDSIPPAALATAGDLLVRTGRVAEAFELLEANRPATDSAEFARAEAGVLLAASQRDRAAERLLDAYQRSGSARDAARAAQTLASTGQTDQALTLIDRALAVTPDDPTLATLRAAVELDSVALSATGPGVDAAAKTIAALRRQIDNPDDTQRLTDDLRWITTEHPTYYPAWALLTDRLLAEGRTEEAAETAVSASLLMPTDPRPARLAVSVLLNVEPLTRALGAARDWQARSRPDTYEADTTAAALLIRLGRIDEASALLARWAERIERDAAAPPVLFRLYAASLITSGRADTAADLFERRRQADARWTAHQIEVARDLIAFHDKPDLARQWLERAIDLEATSADDTLRIAQAAVDLADRTGTTGDLERAVQTATEASRQPSRDSTGAAGLLLAQAHRLSRQPDLAAPIARRITEDYPDNPAAWAVLAHALIEQAEQADQADTPEQALRAAQRAVDLAGERNPASLVALGRARLAAGEPEQAEQAFRTTIGVDPTATEARIGLAEALAAQRKLGDAERIARDPLLRREAARHTLLNERLERLAAATNRQSRFD